MKPLVKLIAYFRHEREELRKFMGSQLSESHAAFLLSHQNQLAIGPFLGRWRDKLADEAPEFLNEVDWPRCRTVTGAIEELAKLERILLRTKELNR